MREQTFGKMIRAGAALLAAAAFLLPSAGCGKTNPATTRKIKAVENGLLRSVHLKGMPSGS